MRSIQNNETRRGVLAFGDSITNGGGELQRGVALQSWALWVARSTGLPFSTYAVDGALVLDVVHDQIPAFERLSSQPDAIFDLGCLYIGVNDVRSPDWDIAAFDRQFRVALSFLAARCDRVLTLTAPLDLGRPRPGARVRGLNDVVERTAADLGALVVDLRGFKGRNLVMADHVHPTAFGQIAIAERALEVLERDGVSVKAQSKSLIRWETTWRKRLREDGTYVYRHAKVSGRASMLALRAVTLTRPARPLSRISKLTRRRFQTTPVARTISGEP